MAQYPTRVQLPKAKPAKPGNRPAPPVTQGDLNRHARMQGEEAKESRIMKKAKGGIAVSAMPKAKDMGSMNMAKGGKAKSSCYAKGGSVSSRADGVAKKGRTNTKMVAMARGGKMKKGC